MVLGCEMAIQVSENQPRHTAVNHLAHRTKEKQLASDILLVARVGPNNRQGA